MKNISSPGMIVFDHDGTLVFTESHEFSLFPGIKELLVDLHGLGFLVSVWTARSHKSTADSLRRLGVTDYVGEIYGHDDGVSKPHPMGLEKLTAGIEKTKLLHIGDSIADLEGARVFGIPVIGACWNSANQVENFRLRTPYIAMTPVECRGIIAKIFNVQL